MTWIIENRLPDRVRVSWFGLRDVRVRARSIALDEELRAIEESLRARFPDPASAASVLAPSRGLYHRLGIDPSKHRPSSEALLRRILRGKELYRVNTAVDAANLSSLTHHRSVGLYDADRIVPVGPAGPGAGSGPAGGPRVIVLRLGEEGESYPGIGKEAIHLAGRPTLVDAVGPFGNPSSDSDRTKVTEETRRLLFVLFEPSEEPEETIRDHLRLSEQILRRHTSGAQDD